MNALIPALLDEIRSLIYRGEYRTPYITLVKPEGTNRKQSTISVSGIRSIQKRYPDHPFALFVSWKKPNKPFDAIWLIANDSPAIAPVDEDLEAILQHYSKFLKKKREP